MVPFADLRGGSAKLPCHCREAVTMVTPGAIWTLREGLSTLLYCSTCWACLTSTAFFLFN